MQETRDDEIEIDLFEVFGLLLHWWWLILISALITGVAGFLISSFVIPEEFKSTTEIYILNNGNNTVTYSDLQMGTQLTNDYSHLITTRDVLEQVIDELGLDDSYGSLKERVSVESPKDTRIVSITVTDQSPVTAQLVADKVRETASEHIRNVMALDAVNVASVANLPTAPSAPNIPKWSLLGFAVGGFICVAIILIRYLLDDSIKTSEDVEHYLGLSTLGMIPLNDVEEAEKDKKKRRHSREFNDTKGGDNGDKEIKEIDLDEEDDKQPAVQNGMKANEKKEGAK